MVSHFINDMIMQIITLSASANKLSKIQERADEYAALIMEELDRDNLGYIEVVYYSKVHFFFFFECLFFIWQLKCLLLISLLLLLMWLTI